MAIVDSQRQSRGRGILQTRFLSWCRIYSSVTTCRFADVVLPRQLLVCEKEGTFTNTERRIQRLYQVFEPIPGSRPDWKITQDIANRLGAGWNYTHPSEIMSEMASVAPLLQGVNYERLEGFKSLQWPVASDGSDQPLLYTKKFNFPDGKARLFPVAWTGPVEKSELRISTSI